MLIILVVYILSCCRLSKQSTCLSHCAQCFVSGDDVTDGQKDDLEKITMVSLFFFICLFLLCLKLLHQSVQLLPILYLQAVFTTTVGFTAVTCLVSSPFPCFLLTGWHEWANSPEVEIFFSEGICTSGVQISLKQCSKGFEWNSNIPIFFSTLLNQYHAFSLEMCTLNATA